MSEDNTKRRVSISKQSNGGNGNAVARRPVGRPPIESEDGYSIRLGEYASAELERLLELTMANRQRVQLRKQQERVERRIDKLLGHDEQQEEE
jgi:hypothetical protein